MTWRVAGWQQEHTLGGVQYDMEAHLQFVTPSGTVAATIAVLLTANARAPLHPFLNLFWNKFDEANYDLADVGYRGIDPFNDLLPKGPVRTSVALPHPILP